VFVLDATDDPAVTAGWAFYLWINGQFYMLSSQESMDINLDWDSIIGRPSSTPAQIDTAVGQAHAHENMPAISRIAGAATGPLNIDGANIFTGDMYTISGTEPDGNVVPRTPLWFRPIS
jgi:hypothetical protein